MTLRESVERLSARAKEIPPWKLGTIVFADNEPTKNRCPDGGTCHHDCQGACFRVQHCSPLSGVFPNDRWPAWIAGDVELGSLRGKCDVERGPCACGAFHGTLIPSREHIHSVMMARSAEIKAGWGEKEERMATKVITRTDCDRCGAVSEEEGAQAGCPPKGWGVFSLTVRGDSEGWLKIEKKRNMVLCDRCCADVFVFVDQTTRFAAAKEDASQDMPKGSKGSIFTLGLSRRATGSLVDSGILTIDTLLAFSEDDLCTLPRFGQTTLNEVRAKLAERGWRLKESS